MSRHSIAMAACQIAAEQTHVDLEQVFARSRLRSSVRARDLALWLMRQVTGWSLTETGLAFATAGGWAIDHTTIHAALKRAERGTSWSERVDLARELVSQMGSEQSI